MNIRKKILKAIAKKGYKATKIYLTRLDEIKLENYIIFVIGGDLAGQLWLKGIRKALPTLFGKEIIWEAKKFKIE